MHKYELCIVKAIPRELLHTSGSTSPVVGPATLCDVGMSVTCQWQVVNIMMLVKAVNSPKWKHHHVR